MSQVVFLQNLQPVHLGFAMHAPVHSGVQLQNLDKLPASIAEMLSSSIPKPSKGSGPSCGGKGSGASSCSAKNNKPG